MSGRGAIFIETGLGCGIILGCGEEQKITRATNLKTPTRFVLANQEINTEPIELMDCQKHRLMMWYCTHHC
jgi:hypothetical protein